MAVRAIRSGALDFFEKPVKGMALVERINEALKDARTRAESERTKAQHRRAHRQPHRARA